MSLFGQIRIPGLVDLHVHFREPGFAYKETILSGSTAACRAGYSDVFTMPNVCPAPDSLEHLGAQQAMHESALTAHQFHELLPGLTHEASIAQGVAVFRTRV